MITYTLTVVIAPHWSRRNYSRKVSNKMTKIIRASKNRWYLCNLSKRGKPLYIQWGYNPWRLYLKGIAKEIVNDNNALPSL